MYPVLGWAPPIFEAGGIRVVVSPERLVLAPVEDNDALLGKIEAAARTVLSTLCHTPVAAFGQNYHYLVKLPSQGLTAALLCPEEERLSAFGATAGVSVTRALSLDSCRLNVGITGGDNVQIGLNYHYEVKQAEDAARTMEGTYIANRNRGLELLKTVYDLTLAKEPGDEQD
jgi:hypothetical protein